MSDGWFEFAGKRLYHSPVEQEWVESALGRAPRTVLEFGSYDGGDGVRYKQWWPGADVYSVEADPELCTNISEGVGKAAGLFTYNYAIMHSPGQTAFYRCLDHEGKPASSGGVYCRTAEARARNPELAFSDEPIIVPAINVALFCERKQIDHLDFMHVDTEGGEYNVLAGLENFRPRCLFLEKGLDTWAHAHAPLYSATQQLAQKLGYRCVVTGEHDDFYVYQGRTHERMV